ncbi:MAG TPA: hypothetical protein ENN87_04630 [Phycisphaerales bacterium]|nr:hypothetical protein [Phycisphaerales bacterium]
MKTSAKRASPPPIPAPAPMAVGSLPELDEAARRERQRLRRLVGYRATLLTERPTLGYPGGGKTLLG